jgi:hypothetical protein
VRPLRLAEREVREAGDAGLVRVDDVEAVGREREREVRARGEREADEAAARRRNRGRERDEVPERLAVLGQALERPPAGGQVGGPRGRPEDDDLVAARRSASAAPATCSFTGAAATTRRA